MKAKKPTQLQFRRAQIGSGQRIGCTFFRRTSSQPTCMRVAPIATAVATKMSQIWMATKKSATGKRSYRNFIQGAHSTRLWYGSRRLRRGGAVPVRHDVDA